MHPDTDSSNWLVNPFPCYLYIPEGCKSREKLSLDFAPSATACQRVWWQEGVQSSAGMGESCGEAQPCGVQRCSPQVLRALLCPLPCPGARSTCTCSQGLGNLYRANTKLTFVSCWKVFEEEKTPACLPGCLFPTLYSKPLYCCVTKGESERERGTKTF